MTDKKFNKRFLIPIPIIAAILIYNFVLKNKDFFYAGTIEATKIEISSRVSSVISSFSATEGKNIKKGDVLVELACEDIKNNFELLDNDFNRAVSLFKSGSLSRENYDHIQSKRTEANIKNDWCTIKSNITGKVLNTFREVDEYVTPGTKLLTLADLSEVWATIYVPQEIHSKIKTGQVVTGIIPELDKKEIKGEITYISDVAEFTPKNVQTRNERTRLIFGVKITFKNPNEILKPGMTIEVNLE